MDNKVGIYCIITMVEPEKSEEKEIKNRKDWVGIAILMVMVAAFLGGGYVMYAMLQDAEAISTDACTYCETHFNESCVSLIPPMFGPIRSMDEFVGMNEDDKR